MGNEGHQGETRGGLRQCVEGGCTHPQDPRCGTCEFTCACEHDRCDTETCEATQQRGYHETGEGGVEGRGDGGDLKRQGDFEDPRRTPTVGCPPPRQRPSDCADPEEQPQQGGKARIQISGAHGIVGEIDHVRHHPGTSQAIGEDQGPSLGAGGA